MKPGLGGGLALLLGLAACARVVTRPAAGEGESVYLVGALSFEAPSDWRASGDERHVRLLAPAEDATIEATAVARPGNGSECLANAEASLARGSSGLRAVQRHGSSFAGQKAVAQEADEGSWHGWAWATCSDGTQYRVWFAGLSPLSRELLEVQRHLLASARMGAAP